MIEQQDQQLLLNLFLAAILYVNAKTEPVNPFVKKIGDSDEVKAFEILLDATNALEHLIPLLEEVEPEAKDVFKSTSNLT